MYVHGFHGCHPMERKTGGDFEVDVHVDTDFSRAAASEKLADTIDYVELMDIIEDRMKERCDLIETVAMKIATAVRDRYSHVMRIEVCVRKLHPPVKQKVDHVSVKYVLD